MYAKNFKEFAAEFRVFFRGIIFFSHDGAFFEGRCPPFLKILATPLVISALSHDRLYNVCNEGWLARCIHVIEFHCVRLDSIG